MASIVRQRATGSRDNAPMLPSSSTLSMSRTIKLLLMAWLGLTAACSPVLDWREVRPEGAGMSLMFPCKPVNDMRDIQVQGKIVHTHLQACKADDQSFALSFADLGDPGLVGPALKQMRESLLAKIAQVQSDPAASVVAVQVKGMTPNPQALSQSFSGQLPDGSKVFGVVAVFAHGTIVYQALVLGAKYDPAARDGFVNGIKLTS